MNSWFKAQEYNWEIVCFNPQSIFSVPKYYVVAIETNQNFNQNYLFATDDEFYEIEDILKTLYKSNHIPICYTYSIKQ